MIRNLSRSLLLLLALVPVLPAAASAADGRHRALRPDPIVFVHGWNSDGSTWRTMANRFRADGWPAGYLDRWTYDATRSNATTAARLAEEIERVLDRTGAAKVDVITHSMGALSSRYYLKNLGGAAKVDAWVSLAGPNHGTDIARLCGGAPCVEMRPGSKFLNSLNSGDETPGTVRYATWRSPCDVIISPRKSVALSGAVNTTTACLGHSELHSDQAVYEQVKKHIG
ncbi:triacylglycerol lipase [Streptomyces sp. NK08204]|uniref:esterase/lipase family protein n=1 Tax=Streptomyces sp. NK08204 TaxID=2873260 RepID=UPI001CEDFDE5|nr:triacylglycerol lipase [Streptomyces sp. NK08204]